MEIQSSRVESFNHPISITLAHEPILDTSFEQRTSTYSAISNLLTRDSTLTATELVKLHALPELSEITARAKTIAETLRSITAEYEQRLSSKTDQHGLLGLIDVNDDEALKRSGLNFGYVQLDEVLAAFLIGNPPVDIETVGPYLCAHVNPETNILEVQMENLPIDEAVGIQMAAIFKKLTRAVGGKIRIVALLDEFNNYVSERGFTEEEQDAYIVSIAELFGRAGVIEPDDEAGKDFLLLRESEQLHKVDDLISRLQASGNGRVVTNEADELVFQPSDDFVSTLNVSTNRRKTFKKHGIVLRGKDGKALCQTLDAAGFLGDENKYLMHLVMLEDHMTSQQDKVFTLLKALGITDEHKYHNVFFDTQNLSPELIVYGITKKLQNHVEKLVDRLANDQQLPLEAA